MSISSVSKLLKLSSYLQEKYSIKESGGLVRNAEGMAFGKISAKLIELRKLRNTYRQEIKIYFDSIAAQDRYILALLEKACVRCGDKKTAKGQAIRQYIDREYKDIMTQLYADGMRNLCSDYTRGFVGVSASEYEALAPLRTALGKWESIEKRLEQIHKSIVSGSESRDMSNVDKTKSTQFAEEIGYNFNVLNEQESDYLLGRRDSIKEMSNDIEGIFDRVCENEQKMNRLERLQNGARSRDLADARRKDFPESDSGEVWVAPPGAPKPTKEQQGPGFF